LQLVGARFQRAIWETDLESLPRLQAWGLRAARVALATARDLTDGQLTLRAMSLVYTTLLSLVPLLAVSFSVLKGFGVHNQLEPLLLQFLAPLGEKGIEITAQIIGFVENLRVGILGSLGVALLFYTVISLIQKVESSFNYVWHAARTRSLGERLSDYLSVVLIGPVLVFSAMGLTASLADSAVAQRVLSIEAVGWAFRLGARLIPLALISGAFTFLYVFLPNTRVRIVSAALGGVTAGVMWQAAGWGFAAFVVTSTRYATIYSGFAILIFFMIWLYVSWLVLLIGASVAFYHQHPEYLGPGRGRPRLSQRLRERVALGALWLIARDHLAGGAAWTTEALARELRVPSDALGSLIAVLERARILAPTKADPPVWLPARALEAVPLREVFDALRSADETGPLRADAVPAAPPVEGVLAAAYAAMEGAIADRTLRDLAGGDGASGSR
jgi:membrane protein